ncbi:MAG TPA: phage holin family protein [Terriglobales bacterium]|nr:phage holin family protein [Terriglobales bacterium]
MDFGITGIPTITVICYLAGMGVKAAGSEKLDRWIPAICGGLGGLLGLVALLLPGGAGGDYIAGVATGIVSGFAATGVNQTVKQLGGGENP